MKKKYRKKTDEIPEGYISIRQIADKYNITEKPHRQKPVKESWRSCLSDTGIISMRLQWNSYSTATRIILMFLKIT